MGTFSSSLAQDSEMASFRLYNVNFPPDTEYLCIILKVAVAQD
jgi:hypothetical protein